MSIYSEAKLFKRISVILFLFFMMSFISAIFGQTMDSLQTHEKSAPPVRYRVITGYVSLIADEVSSDFHNPFINLNFRSGGLREGEYPVRVKVYFESGLNILFTEEVKSSLFCLPYAKFGLELFFTRNFSFAGNIGLLVVWYKSDMTWVPFTGLHSAFVYNFSNSLNFEIEVGLNTTFPPIYKFYLVYFTFGISIN
ncbi:MAG: hypothetical protein A2V66_12170 [Ignavibacteria bacterium RBG_13_36_8]|nr:MAG: hypothetical protein A2V66_12170 [Ignavibacteria bacterium RBG_13_36_8]